MTEASTSPTANPAHARIAAEIAENPVMLYMKGTADMPMCGFSSVVVQVLRNMGIPFKTANVLEDEALRQGIKAFSNWPTIPQLYVKGEFVGGCDIVKEMYSSGELGEFFSQHGIAVNSAGTKSA